MCFDRVLLEKPAVYSHPKTEIRPGTRKFSFSPRSIGDWLDSEGTIIVRVHARVSVAEAINTIQLELDQLCAVTVHCSPSGH